MFKWESVKSIKDIKATVRAHRLNPETMSLKQIEREVDAVELVYYLRKPRVINLLFVKFSLPRWGMPSTTVTVTLPRWTKSKINQFEVEFIREASKALEEALAPVEEDVE